MPQGHAKHPPAVVDEVIRLAREGYSRTVIGEKFKLSRSSICGILHRAGYKSPKPPPPEKKAKPRPRTAKPIVSSETIKPPPAKLEIFSNFNPAGVTLDDLQHHHCRWILDTGRYCGDHKREGSYCSGHARLAYNRIPAHRKAA